MTRINKRFLFFLTCIMMITTSATSQVKGGIKGGLNVTDMIITNGGSYFGETAFNSRASYHFGTYFQKNFSKHFGFQIEMLFSNKGYTFKTDSLSSNISLNYLNWPLLLEYQMGDRLDFSAGIELGLLVTGEELYRNFDLGIDVGVEYDVSNKITAGLRYSHGLPFKMKVESYEFIGEEPKYQLSVIQFYIGFNIVNEMIAE